MSIRLGDSIIARANMDFSDVTSLLTETNELINNVIENDDTNTTVITDSLSENKDAINISISNASDEIIKAVQSTVNPDMTTTNNMLQSIITNSNTVLNLLSNMHYTDLTTVNNLIQNCIQSLSTINTTMNSISDYQSAIFSHVESIDTKLS